MACVVHVTYLYKWQPSRESNLMLPYLQYIRMRGYSLDTLPNTAGCGRRCIPPLGGRDAWQGELQLIQSRVPRVSAVYTYRDFRLEECVIVKLYDLPYFFCPVRPPCSVAGFAHNVVSE